MTQHIPNKDLENLKTLKLFDIFERKIREEHYVRYQRVHGGYLVIHHLHGAQERSVTSNFIPCNIWDD